MEKLANVHPGEILFYEFLEPLEITAYRLSKDLKIPQTQKSREIFRYHYYYFRRKANWGLRIGVNCD